MSLQLVFRIAGGILFINGLSFLFLTEMFLGMAGFTMTPSLITLGEGMGTALIALGLIAWRTPDVAGESIIAYGQIWGIVSTLWVLLIGYHAATGQASGPPIYGNLFINASLAVLFFMNSKGK